MCIYLYNTFYTLVFALIEEVVLCVMPVLRLPLIDSLSTVVW